MEYLLYTEDKSQSPEVKQEHYKKFIKSLDYDIYEAFHMIEQAALEHINSRIEEVEEKLAKIVPSVIPRLNTISGFKDALKLSELSDIYFGEGRTNPIKALINISGEKWYFEYPEGYEVAGFIFDYLASQPI